ncbi:hypothetical protein VIGAN_03233900, partial [Vigna angularis var. angularis]
MVTCVHLTEYLCWSFCTNWQFLSGNRLQGCCKRLPEPFFSSLTHSLHYFVPLLITGHSTLLAFTSITNTHLPTQKLIKSFALITINFSENGLV